MGIRDGAKKVAGGAARVGKDSVVGYWRGLTFPFKGLAFVFFRHPGLVRFWIFPILITVALLAASFWGGLEAHEAITDWMWSDPGAEVAGAGPKSFPPTDVDKAKAPLPGDKVLAAAAGIWDGAGHVAHVALEILVLILLWTLGLLVVVLLSNVIAAPFNDLLSEEVEHLVTGTKGPPFSLRVLLRDTVRTVGLEVVKLIVYLVVMVPLWLLSLLLPGVGQVLYTIFAFLFTALYFAVDYIDWPASRRNKSTTYRFGVMTEHFMPMLGFGTGVWLFLFIPLVNLLFMPAAVAGGTLLFLELEGELGAAPAATPEEPVSPAA